MSTSFASRPKKHLLNLSFVRVELDEGSGIKEHKDFIHHDTAAIKDVRDVLRASAWNKCITKKSIETDTTSFSLMIAQSDLSQLVMVHKVHQTRWAAKSVKTCANPQDVASNQHLEQTDCQRLCTQMTEFIH